MRRRALSFVACGITFAALVAGCNRNQPPAAPIVTGPSNGKAGATLAYTFSSADPDNDDIEYLVDWGEAPAQEWSPAYPSGQPVTQTHVFAVPGAYRVKVKARDARAVESGWSDSLNVVVSFVGGPPSGVAVSAGPGESDSTVVISWTPPADTTPDKYIVWFRAVTDTSYVPLGMTTGTSYEHNPHGMTGRYKVGAQFDIVYFEDPDSATTVPAAGGAVTLFEINADPNRCAFGWARDSGNGSVYGMADSANCASVDFYISDLQIGVGGPLDVVSPNKANSIDSGAVGVVPAAAWRLNGFSNPLPDPQSPLPGYQPPPYANYFIYTQISSQPCYISCYTAGDTLKHYALVQMDSVDVSSGRVWVQSWYQLVPGLRLIQH